MIDKSLSTRSKGKFLAFSRHRGFSLVEVMMSVVLIAISMALALPSYRDMVEKRQVTNGAEQLASFINTAQGASMKSNRVVTVSWSHTDANNWCIGAVASEDACDCTETNAASENYCQIGAQDFVLSDDIAAERGLMYRMTGGGGSYAFDPIRGVFVDLDDALALELRSRSGDFRLNLMVNSTGRVTLCSDDASHAVPGYEVCELEREVQFVEAGP